uniref:WSN domain-containing protein n=1 Tax=Caenorhabditis tropicalis TaxID=1561998 RepID=A0A1I7UDB6_9PELO
MRKSITIIICIAILSSSIGSSNKHSARRPRLDFFLDDVTTLISLTDGIVRQSKISQDFIKQTSKFFHANSKKFASFYKLDIESVSEDVSKFHDEIQKLNLKSNFDELYQSVQLLSSLAVDRNTIQKSINLSLLNTYEKEVDALCEVKPKLKPPELSYLLIIHDCLLVSLTDEEVITCQKILESIDIKKVRDDFQMLHKIFSDISGYQTRVIQKFHDIEHLETVLLAASRFSNGTEVFKSLATSLSSSSKELIEIDLIAGQTHRLSKKMKLAIIGPEIRTDIQQAEAIRQLLILFDSTWFRRVLSPKLWNKLKIGMDPILKYAKTLNEIGNLMEKLRQNKASVEEVKTRIKYIEEWDGASTIGTNFISTIENCLKNISEENSSVDFQNYETISRSGHFSKKFFHNAPNLVSGLPFSLLK